MLWNHGVSQAGVAHGRHTITRMLEFLTLHSGLGVLITALAAYALPGAAAYAYGRRRVARDAAAAETGAAVGAAETRHRDRVAERDRVPERGAVPVGAGAGTAGAGGAAAGTAAGATEAEAAAGGHPADPSSPRPASGDGATGPGAASQPNGGGAADGTQTRRRGGLAGLFSRR
jgi:hypothetical protein